MSHFRSHVKNEKRQHKKGHRRRAAQRAKRNYPTSWDNYKKHPLVEVIEKRFEEYEKE